MHYGNNKYNDSLDKSQNIAKNPHYSFTTDLIHNSITHYDSYLKIGICFHILDEKSVHFPC